MKKLSEKKFKLEKYLDYIYSIFIIDNSGILKHIENIKGDEKRTDPALVNALFTAISDFAEELGQGEVGTTDIEGKKYVFQKESEYFIVLEVKNDLDDELAKKILQEIVERLDLPHKLGLENGQISLIAGQKKMLDFSILAEIKKHMIKPEKPKDGVEVHIEDLSPAIIPYDKLVKIKSLFESVLKAQERILGIFLAAPWNEKIQMTIADKLEEKDREIFLEAMLKLVSEQENSFTDADEALRVAGKFSVHISRIISAEGGFISIIVDSPYLLSQLRPFLLRFAGTIEQIIYS